MHFLSVLVAWWRRTFSKKPVVPFHKRFQNQLIAKVQAGVSTEAPFHIWVLELALSHATINQIDHQGHLNGFFS